MTTDGNYIYPGELLVIMSVELLCYTPERTKRTGEQRTW